MKCIFIILDLGFAIRNVLRTDIFRVLQSEQDIRIVIFSPIVDEEFRKEFESERVIVEQLPKWNPRNNLIVRNIRSLKKDIWIQASDVQAFKLRRRRQKRRTVKNYFISFFRSVLSRDGLFSAMHILHKIEESFSPRLCSQLFEKYNPDLVFYTHLYPKDPCIEIEAQKRNIKTIGLLLSWDNPTTKGPFIVRPDKIIVWNEILKDEIVTHHRVDPSDVLISGVPQFDIYTYKDRFRSREDFFRTWGLDPEKRLLTYTTGSAEMFPYETEIVEILYNALQKNSFISPAQILLRLHPKDFYHRYEGLKDKPGIRIQMPGRAAHTPDRWNPSVDDMYGLAELMRYSDVVINIASTISLDAACFDRPVVNISFDGSHDKPYPQSSRKYYDYEHYRNVVKTGGVRIARTSREMIDLVNMYLLDPSLDAEGRQRLRDEQCWKLDGNAGKRIAGYLLDYLRESN